MQNELMELVMGYEGKWLGLGLGLIVGEWGGWRVSLCLICTVDIKPCLIHSHSNHVVYSY